MTRPVLALAVWLLATPVLAQVSPTDFARGAEVQAEGGSIFRLLLPDDVYETVTRRDLGDVRVLNASGETVPHALRRAAPPAPAHAEWRSVPSFPMSDLQPGRQGRTQVRVDASGAVLEVTSDAAQQPTTAYLVDVSAIDEPLARLALTWNASADVRFLARITVQGSNDLNTWRTIVTSAAVAQLQRDGLALTQNEIELPDGDPVRYLRISWPRELATVTMSAVRVRTRAAAAVPEIRWRTLTADAIDGSTGAARYDTRGMFPVEYIDLEFVDPTDAASLAVRSRPAPSAAWQPRHDGLFYSLEEANGSIRSAAARIPVVADRYWTLEQVGGDAWSVATAPRLKVGWHPHELVFLAQGAPPYTLVYGSARMAAADAPLDALLRELEAAERGRQLRATVLGPPRTLGGADALTPPPPLRRVMLWGILAAAVALLAWLAIRTLRETAAADSPPQP